MMPSKSNHEKNKHHKVGKPILIVLLDIPIKTLYKIKKTL